MHLFFAKGISVPATRGFNSSFMSGRSNRGHYIPQALEGEDTGDDIESDGLIVSFSGKPSNSQRITGNVETDAGGK